MKFPFAYITECAIAVMERSEATVCKIRTESSIAGQQRETEVAVLEESNVILVYTHTGK